MLPTVKESFEMPTAILQQLLTVQDPNPDRWAFLFSVPFDEANFPDGVTCWNLGPISNEGKARAMQLAVDQGWNVVTGSEWTWDIDKSRWQITIEIMNTTE